MARSGHYELTLLERMPPAEALPYAACEKRRRGFLVAYQEGLGKIKCMGADDLPNPFFRVLVARINAHLAQHDLLNHTGRQAGSTIQQALFFSSRIPDEFCR